jgi:hypothetical protein
MAKARQDTAHDWRECRRHRLLVSFAATPGDIFKLTLKYVEQSQKGLHVETKGEEKGLKVLLGFRIT